MNNMDDDVKKLAEIIGKNFKVNKIFLFGSYARGNFNNESDIDMCILTDENIKKLDMARNIRKVLYEHTVKPLDLLIYKTEDFYSRADSLKSIEREILNEGLEIYG